MEERLGEMRKGRRERIEKGSHCFFKSSGYDKLELMLFYVPPSLLLSINVHTNNTRNEPARLAMGTIF